MAFGGRPLLKLLKSEDEKPIPSKSIENDAKSKLPLKKVDTREPKNGILNTSNPKSKNTAKNERVEAQKYSLRPRISKPQVYFLKITENV